MAASEKGRAGLTNRSGGVIICMLTHMSKQRHPSKSSAGCCGIPGMPEPRFFKALCDPTRLRILAHLAEARETRTVSEIAERFPLDVSVVSRHLAVLRDAGILVAEKQGKEVRYSVGYESVVSVLRGFARAIESCCPARNTGGS